MKMRRKIITIDETKCDGCGVCVPACAEGAIRIIGGKARLVAQRYCDGLGACLGECPRGALSMIETDADAFDEATVHAQMKATPVKEREPLPTLACGCPSATMETFKRPHHNVKKDAPHDEQTAPSELTHWPVQIRLVPPSAPFLKKADLLVAADCTPVAYPRFHEDFMRGKTVLIGCPKFDDADFYVERFADIFTNADIASVTVVVMEVPCCQGLPHIVREAMKRAQKTIPLETIILGRTGAIMVEKPLHGGGHTAAAPCCHT
ncbi:MAG: 4Fe-4S dicluster domain-containing protein [Deltaproteobacteria bacterium]|nr:4Fe-4S dicluster domain-containing protein [Deltaproteobacteria bacterium]